MHTKITTICRLAIALFLSALVIFSTSTLANQIAGAGATFPYPIYAKWAETYKARTGIGLNYQSIGSGGGIKQIVDFGASDVPLKPEVLEKNDLTQFPTVLADIFMGKIQKWNDPAIAALNKDLRLPATANTVIHRSAGSGTTFIFANYLVKVSPEWKQKAGNDTSVAWPAGIGGKGNEGVSSFVQRIQASIGYVEYAYAKQNKISHALKQNKESLLRPQPMCLAPNHLKGKPDAQYPPCDMRA